MTFYPTDRLALFIDGPNLHAAAKTLGFDIDFKRLLDEFRKRGLLTRALYYTTLMEASPSSPSQPRNMLIATVASAGGAICTWNWRST